LRILLKIISISAGISLLCILLLSITFNIYAQKALTNRVMDQLQSVVVIKENQLNNYLSRSMVELKDLSGRRELVDYMLIFHDGYPDDVSRHDITGNTSRNLAGFGPNATDASMKSKNALEYSYESNVSKLLFEQIDGSEFDELMIVESDGEIDFSTNSSNDGKNVSGEDYFILGMNQTYIQDFYENESSDDPSMFVSRPILSGDGHLLGLIVGRIRSDDIQKIMIERSGLGETGETFLVSKNNVILTRSRFVEGAEFKKKLYTKAVNTCVRGNSGSGIYNDYRDTAVLEMYRWLPERNICLMAKIDEHEAFMPLNDLLMLTVLCGILALIIAIVASVLLSKTILDPLEKLTKGTKELSSGNFMQEITIHTGDELEMLADSINHTGKELSHARDIEKNYSRTLEEQLNAKTSEMKKSLEELESSKKAALNIMEDLSEINAHLKELDQAKTDFLNIASHELKTPLTAISAYLEILDDYKGQFNEQQLQGLDAIKRNSNQLKMLINNILEISRLESGRFELNVNDIDVKEKLGTILDNLRILSDSKGIELRQDISGVTNMSTDAMRFEEIINNLVGNAIKFTDKGSITVELRQGTDVESGFAVFSVTDTGVGIPENKMSNLFKNFYQVDSGISRKYGGTGLGLAITKRMIELQGGKITVESAVGKGTTFRFTLPIKAIPKKEKTV